MPDVADLLSRLHRAYAARFMGALHDSGFADVTPAFAAVMPLVEEGGSRQAEMARRAGLSKQAIGQLVRELAARGYVELVADPGSARARLVRLTPRGLALRAHGFAVKRAMAQEVAAVLAPPELIRLEAALRLLLAEEDGRTAGPGFPPPAVRSPPGARSSRGARPPRGAKP